MGYCEKCGSQLEEIVVGAEEAFVWKSEYVGVRYPRYDRYTGKRMVIVRLKCPNKRFWNRGHFSRTPHDPFPLDELHERVDSKGGSIKMHVRMYLFS